MTSRRFVNYRLVSILLIAIGALVAATPRIGCAWHGATMAAWHATWHAPNALDSPLRQYFIPRAPGRCDRDVFAEGFEYEDSSGNTVYVQGTVGYQAPCPTADAPPACTACLAVRSERLGQIPNDLESEMAVAAGASGR
jgi:hypothetical protein